MNKSAIRKPKITPEDIEAGKRLKNIRERKGISRKKLSAYLDVSHQQLQKYEKGETSISGQMLYDIHKYFGVPMESFFKKEGQPNDNRLSVKDLIHLDSSEFEHIEESINRQTDRHIDWIHDVIELFVKSTYDQSTVNAHYEDIHHVSIKRIISLNEKILKRLKKDVNEDIKP